MPRRAPTIGPKQIDLLRRLCEATGVSGGEGQVREIVLSELKDKVDDVRVDALGNVLATKRGRGQRRLRVMLDAHMDEVGFMIVAEDSDGIYQFETIGGIDPQNLPGKQVTVGKDNTPGVIGAKAIHLTKSEELKSPISTDKLRVDLGPGGKAKVGDRGTFAANFRRAGPALMSKALDNRLGVATLIELVKAAPFQADLLAAFTVQEEIGLRGAKVAANFFKPDLALVIDATPARDLPMQREGENTTYNTQLGLGPAIYLSHRETIDDPRLVDFLVETANRQRIPFQFRQPGGGSNDSGGIQRAGAGVPVASVSVPHRYTHSAVSISRVEDWQNTLALLLASVSRMPTDILRRGV
jgi:putative aminopeptidase FrvX